MIAQAGAIYAMFAAIVGGAISAVALIWNARRTDHTEQRNTSGTVATADSAVVFANQIAAFEASEKLRHDTAALLASQIERCEQEKHERDERIERLEKALLGKGGV